MTQDPLTDELLALEHRFWRAMQDKDGAAATQLTAEACILTGAQGVSKFAKADMAKMMAAGGWTLKSYEFSDVQVQRISADVAVIGYKVREDLEVDGEPISFEAADASTWVRQGEDWVCALHTESVLGDPFGRDRKPAV